MSDSDPIREGVEAERLLFVDNHRIVRAMKATMYHRSCTKRATLVPRQRFEFGTSSASKAASDRRTRDRERSAGQRDASRG